MNRSLVGHLQRALALVCALGASTTIACFEHAERGQRDSEAPRGLLLVTLGGVRADALTAYGNDRDATPFLASLAERALVVDWMIAASSEPLPAQTSLITGLYPGEHGVRLPEHELSPAIPTIAEHLSAHGFHTAAHSAGGFLVPRFGFHRGFDTFSVEESSRAVLQGGLRSLEELRRHHRFFLFLHLGRAAEASSGESLPHDPVRYRVAIQNLDSQLEQFFGELERRGARRELAVIIVGDRGWGLEEERPSRDSGTYLEQIHVPLLILTPEDRLVGRSSRLAETVDIGPTLVHLAGLAPLPFGSGENIAHPGRAPDASWAYSETSGWARQQSLLGSQENRLEQLVYTTYRAESDGTWVSGTASFDAGGERLELDLVAFHQPREITVQINGEDRPPLLVTPRWRTFELVLGPSSRRSRVSLATAGCDSPRALGLSKDPRCLSFKVRDLELTRSEVFDLRADPRGLVDRSRELEETRLGFAQRLLFYRPVVVGAPLWRPLETEAATRLRTLGYLP